MSRKILGIDIRSSSATAVLMETGFKKRVITGFGHAPFSKSGGFQERLAGALTTISQAMDLTDCICAMSVPSSRFFYRNASVPFSETKKIHQVLPYELEAAVPFAIEELLIDFSKIPLPGADGETRIISAGIETAWLKSLIDTVEACGITPTIVFPGGYPMAAWLCSKISSDDNQIFIDFDGADFSLYLLLAGNVALIRSFTLASSQARSAMTLWGQIQRSIAGFESLFEVKITPASLIINGVHDEKFPRQLETVASLPVSTLYVTPPTDSEVPAGNQESFSPRSCFNGAFSCALYLLEGFKGMNFRKGPLASRNRLAEYRNRLIRTAVFACAVLLLWVAGVLIEIHITRNQVDQLQAGIISIFKGTFPDIRNIVDPVRQMETELDTVKQAAFGSGNTTTQIRTIDMLSDISQSIPAETDVQLTKSNFAEDGINITGTTDSFGMVNDIGARLEKIDWITSVKTSTDRDGDRIRFNLKIETTQEETS